MKKFWIFILAVCLVNGAFGQKKSKGKNKQITEVKAELPPVDVIEETKISELDVPPPPPPPASQIDFDTTAAPQDAFTDSIRKLLLVTGAKGKDIEMAEKSLRQSLASLLQDPGTNEMGEKLISRFLYEMKEGSASRWMENMYIKTYRSLFTQEEISHLIEFYQTPAGRKTLEKSVLLLETIMTEARKIGAYLGPKIMEAVMAEDKNK